MKTFLALLMTLAAIALSACSGEDDARPPASDIPEAEVFNQADVDFATDMIQHHAQALLLVDLTDKRELSPEVAALAEQILMVQGPEIETMVDLLTDWDQPIPETVRDHANVHADDGMAMHSDLPGMVSAEDLAALEATPDAEFEQKWLELMIEHHEGAIDMATTERSEGEFAEAIALAEGILDAQQDEIDDMTRLQR